jgi:hypothetical protein
MLEIEVTRRLRRTGETVQRRRTKGCPDDAKTRTRGIGIRILQREPPRIDFPKDITPNLIPISLRIRNTRDGQILRRPTDRPSRLGNPNRFPRRICLGGIIRRKEDVVADINSIRFGVLEIGVCVHTEKIAIRNDIRIRAVDPRCPGIDVADESGIGSRACDRGTDLLDVPDDDGRSDADSRQILRTNNRVAIQVLAPDGNTGNQAGELSSVLGDGGREGGEFVGEIGVAGRGPETEEQSCVGGDRRGDGFCGRVCGAALDHGVETGAGEARGADELLGRGKEVCELRLCDDGAIRVGGTVIEALVHGRDRGSERGEGEERLEHGKMRRRDEKEGSGRN